MLLIDKSVTARQDQLQQVTEATEVGPAAGEGLRFGDLEQVGLRFGGGWLGCGGWDGGLSGRRGGRLG